MTKSARISLSAGELRFISVAIELAFNADGFPKDDLSELALYMSARAKLEKARERLARDLVSVPKRT
ncbi:hypothetical protein [Aquamicrobium defluvii]|uniref:Uncharacterized protein n=1 Tax=Aquamicrobium defluvii TaxID=69279 RepID=A0A4R6YCP0_9HYPH|nr:hypothetical protein [Aquamicrobium defluvii]EZQ13666.1 hypothetical protein CF98_24025 [Halopseudomonas bauzanensis]TDR33577.1 hypothetical protein DES43_12165 [Aquamicrobium defluvii]